MASQITPIKLPGEFDVDAIGGGLPISPYVTTVSFLIYLVCRVIGWRRDRAGNNGRLAPSLPRNRIAS